MPSCLQIFLFTKVEIFICTRKNVFRSADAKNICRTMLQNPTCRYVQIASPPLHSLSAAEFFISSSMDDLPIWRQPILFMSLSEMICCGQVLFSEKR